LALFDLNAFFYVDVHYLCLHYVMQLTFTGMELMEANIETRIKNVFKKSICRDGHV